MKDDQPKNRPRPYIGMHFKCCHVYARVYLNRRGDAFFGHCPKCMRPVRIPVAPGGRKSRFWTAE